jgi:hypothetical protein
MTQTTDCPICCEIIKGPQNIVITSCGHSFHCSCLVHHVAKGRINCPICRMNLVNNTEKKNTDIRVRRKIIKGVLYYKQCDGDVLFDIRTREPVGNYDMVNDDIIPIVNFSSYVENTVDVD